MNGLEVLCATDWLSEAVGYIRTEPGVHLG